MRKKAFFTTSKKRMKPGTLTHTLAVIISSITSFFTHSAPAKILPAKEKMSKKSDRASEDPFSLLQTTTAFVPAREDPPRHAERYPWKKEIVSPMRNGKMLGRFVPIIGNTFSVTSDPNQI